jgi:predicted secreted protein
MLPSLVELATAAGDFEPLRRVCRERGDEITFAATLAAECARDG